MLPVEMYKIAIATYVVLFVLQTNSGNGGSISVS